MIPNHRLSIIKGLLRRFIGKNYPIRLLPKDRHPKGSILFSYLPDVIRLPENDPGLDGHTNKWESRAIAHILANLGYQVDAVRWDDLNFKPNKHYEIVFDICYNLGRWANELDSSTLKLLHCTGSYVDYQNAAELQRVQSVNQRRNGHYVPKRQIENASLNHQSLQAADFCTLLGNAHTHQTYPSNIRNKIHLQTVSGSRLGNAIKSEDKYLPQSRQFLWFFGGGAVHKGLDLVLEVFAHHPQLTLNIIGNIDCEADFIEMYHTELFERQNIRYHGPLNPNSVKFEEIVTNCFCFIAPTCSEGISPAVVTCMQIGLYPMISLDCGVELPDDCGQILPTCTLEEIEQAVLKVWDMEPSALTDQIRACQKLAFKKYSRSAFIDSMYNFLSKTIQLWENGQSQ